MDEVDKLLDEVLGDEDTESEFGRARAYRRCVRFAEENLAFDHRCNLFLAQAAERLGQLPLAMPIVQNRVQPAPDAALSFFFHEEEGGVLVGNQAGLAYLGRLCGELAQAMLPGENVVLEPDEPCMVGDCERLVLYHESEEWFEAAELGQEDELVGEWEAELESRIVASDDVVAVQVSGGLSRHASLSPQKLYRVQGVQPWDPYHPVPRKTYRSEVERVRVLTLEDDEGQTVKLAVDLDDPDLNFFYGWHLAQIDPGLAD